MVKSTRTPADVPDHIGEATRTLNKLHNLWRELWDQQYDHDWRPEDATVSSSKPSSRLLHDGQPTKLQQHYLRVQRAVRDAYRIVGGTWTSDTSNTTIHPPAMRQVTSRLIDRLNHCDDLDAARRACETIQAAWSELPPGVRGEAKGGARRCTHCTEPAERGRTKCGRHKYAKNRAA